MNFFFAEIPGKCDAMKIYTVLAAFYWVLTNMIWREKTELIVDLKVGVK